MGNLMFQHLQQKEQFMQIYNEYNCIFTKMETFH